MKPSVLFFSIGRTHTLGLQCSSAWVTSRESLQYNTLNFCFLYPSVFKITRDHDDWIHCFTPPKLFFSMDCCAFVEFLVQQNKTKQMQVQAFFALQYYGIYKQRDLYKVGERVTKSQGWLITKDMILLKIRQAKAGKMRGCKAEVLERK